ncbi:YncE family protein [Bradyrhizobium sp. CCGUVB23]|uniref:YncE family protein n=1 Tax=Bradyrhizobium sp. CCGUVB23 TaxID=2949630 RepID=UPI0020B3E9AA|nr:YncE family protein [Bradyrhizobium sp. CCGUVB23]MCP3468064.1 YncE family protein [Bradyrhizobium sp. CCGUVB23]
MNLRNALCAMYLVGLIGGSGSAQAGTNDILIGLDSKITYGPEGQTKGAPGNDAVLVIDVSAPAKPKIRASVPVANSLLGPPTNLQITPDGKLGLVANSVVHIQEGNAWKTVPDDKLYVIDLTAAPPKVIDAVTVGRQPSGLSISKRGDLALIANREGKSVSVVSIQGTTVKAVREVPLEQQAAAVVIAPDGERTFVCLNLANKIGVLAIDGQDVTYDNSMDIPSAFNPYNIDITPDGKYVIASNTGALKNNADAAVIIEATGPHPHVVDLMSPGVGPEGFAIAPDGKTAATPLLLGSSTKRGELVLMSIGTGGSLTVTARAPLGRLPEGVAYSPNSDYLYVANYVDRDLQVFDLAGGKLTETGSRLKLPGQPASMRAPAR